MTSCFDLIPLCMRALVPFSVPCSPGLAANAIAFSCGEAARRVQGSLIPVPYSGHHVSTKFAAF